MKKTILLLAAGAGLLYLASKNTGNSFKSNYKGTKGQLPSSYPRGVRNNNPGNLRISSGNTFVGRILPKDNTDGAFEQFITYEHGVRALIITLKNYIANGFNTIEKIISRYAPSTENDTEAYIKRVSEAMDMRAGKKIKNLDRDTAKKLVTAIINVENAGNYLTEAQFIKAWLTVL